MWHENRLPDWLTLLCFTVISVVFVVRMIGCRVTVVDRQINQIVAFGLLTVLAREPAVARQLAPVLDPALLYDVWHWLFVMFCISCLGALILGDRGPDHYRKPYRFWLAAGVLVGIAFVFLSHWSRKSGLNMAQGGGWQYGAYFALYALPTCVMCAYAVRSFAALRGEARTVGEKTAVAAIFFASLIGALNMVVLAVGAIMSAAGVDDSFTVETEVRASGELILPFVAFASLALVPSAGAAVAQIFRIDRDSREARQLTPLWTDVTAVVPEVVLPLDRAEKALQKPSERLYRRRVENYDAVAIIARSMSPINQSISADEYRALFQHELRATLDRAIIEGLPRGPVAGSGAALPDSVDTLAHEWRAPSASRALITPR